MKEKTQLFVYRSSAVILTHDNKLMSLWHPGSLQLTVKIKTSRLAVLRHESVVSVVSRVKLRCFAASSVNVGGGPNSARPR